MRSSEILGLSILSICLVAFLILAIVEWPQGAKRWFARGVIFAIPAAIIALWVYGNYVILNQIRLNVLPTDGKVSLLVVLTGVVDAIAIIFILAGFIINLPSIVSWLWKTAELRGKRSRFME